jgi:hypothetical protein
MRALMNFFRVWLPFGHDDDYGVLLLEDLGVQR